MEGGFLQQFSSMQTMDRSASFTIRYVCTRYRTILPRYRTSTVRTCVDSIPLETTVPKFTLILSFFSFCIVKRLRSRSEFLIVLYGSLSSVSRSGIDEQNLQNWPGVLQFLFMILLVYVNFGRKKMSKTVF